MEKNESGAHKEQQKCCRTVLTLVLKALTIKLMGKSACWCSSLVAAAKAALAMLKAWSISGDQTRMR